MMTGNGKRHTTWFAPYHEDCGGHIEETITAYGVIEEKCMRCHFVFSSEPLTDLALFRSLG